MAEADADDVPAEPDDVPAEPDEAPAEAEGEDSELIVVEEGDDEEAFDPGAEIDRPDKLMRLAGQIRGLLNQVHAADLDEAGRDRLTEIHNTVVEQLSELVSDDLQEELEDMSLTRIEQTPTGSELEVFQAQLGGWLEGLFQGIQASVASRQAAQQRQLMQRMQQPGEQSQTGTGPGSSGQYL